MQTPTSGEILDLDYVGGFYAELAPVRLDFIAALNGTRGPNLNNEFTYCELGCGLGETTSLLAASNPNGQFFGIDLSESHIAAATRLAADGHVDNVQFLAADVARLDHHELPDFDFITMHGLYSWVPEPVRQAIDKFITDKLRPGGLLYLSYNAQPGAFNIAILRRFYLERAARLDGNLIDRADAITRELEALRSSGAPLFRENPTAAKLFEIIRDSDRRYLVHEMFAEGWQPFAFSEVHARMSAAGLQFVGDGEVLENLLEHCTLPDWTAQIAAMTHRAEQEALKDLIHNRTFRRDVYRRPHPDDAAPRRDDPLTTTLLCTTQSAENVSSRVKVTGGTLDLAGPWFDRVRQLLDDRILTIDEILNDPSLAGCPRNDLLNGLKLATIDGAIGPAIRRECSSAIAGTAKVTPELNRVLLQRFDFNRPQLVLASPVTGRGVNVSRMEAMVLAAIEQPAPEQWMRDRMQQAGISLKGPDGSKPLSSSAEQLTALQAIVNEFRRLRAPKLTSLGILKAQAE